MSGGELRLISSRCYPSKKEVEEYIGSIEKLDDVGVRTILKIILCSGLRVGEVLNARVFSDDENNIIIRTLASKTKQLNDKGIKLGMGEKQSRFLGRDFLNRLQNSNLDVFKSVKLENIFNVDFDDILDLVDEYDKANYVAEHVGIYNYITAYIRLKRNIDDVKVKYKAGKYEEKMILRYKPSFHFYRKLFSAEYYEQTKNVLATIDKMKWTNLNRIITYVKDY